MPFVLVIHGAAAMTAVVAPHTVALNASAVRAAAGQYGADQSNEHTDHGQDAQEFDPGAAAEVPKTQTCENTADGNEP